MIEIMGKLWDGIGLSFSLYSALIMGSNDVAHVRLLYLKMAGWLSYC